METRIKRKNHSIVFDLSLNAFYRIDKQIENFLSRESLPVPLDCRPKCYYCCYNIPLITPPEALLIGYHVDHNYTDMEKEVLMKNIKTINKKITGLNPVEIVMIRQELPCIFLTNNICAIYSLRPVVCRACSSTSADHCKNIFETGNHRSRLLCYQQIRKIFETVHLKLIKSCEDMNCQADAVGLVEAMEILFNYSHPVDAWLQGKRIFST